MSESWGNVLVTAINYIYSEWFERKMAKNKHV
jgi:hypothetical protein